MRGEVWEMRIKIWYERNETKKEELGKEGNK